MGVPMDMIFGLLSNIYVRLPESMRNYAEMCKGICSHNLGHNFFIYLLPLKTSVFVVDFSNAFWHGKEALAKHGS